MLIDQYSRCRSIRAFVVLVVGVFSLGICSQCLLGQESVDQQLSEHGDAALDEVLLRWKSRRDDVIPVQMRVNETHLEDANNQFRTETIYDYRWDCSGRRFGGNRNHYRCF